MIEVLNCVHLQRTTPWVLAYFNLKNCVFYFIYFLIYLYGHGSKTKDYSYLKGLYSNTIYLNVDN